MARTYEEMFEYELNRLRGDRTSQNLFFGKAIAIQNSRKTITLDYAEKKMNFACDVLCHCDYCNHTMCDSCKLTEAHTNAVKDILSGARRAANESRIIEWADGKKYILKRHINKNGQETLTLIEYR